MQAKEFLLEGSVLDAALRRGWVYIKYVTLEGRPRVLTATTNHKNFIYVYRRAKKVPGARRNITVWEKNVGWRALRRNRILGWAEVRPDTDPAAAPI